jgi:hypothetical protein
MMFLNEDRSKEKVPARMNNRSLVIVSSAECLITSLQNGFHDFLNSHFSRIELESFSI